MYPESRKAVAEDVEFDVSSVPFTNQLGYLVNLAETPVSFLQAEGRVARVRAPGTKLRVVHCH